MNVAYTLYINEPSSRNLDEKVDPEAAEQARLRDLHRIDYLIHSAVEDLSDLLPPGYTIQTARETL